MKRNLISMPSAWGRAVEHHHYSNSSKSLVAVFPGNQYSCDRPLLHYAGKSALEQGHDLLLLEYGFQSARTKTKIEQEDESILVYECKHALDQVKDQYDEILFVSKSLGTLIAGQVSEIIGNKVGRQLFLTPLSRTIPIIRNCSCTVIYGTADPSFTSGNAEEIGGLEHVIVHPIEGANHVLELGTAGDSVRLLGDITGIYTKFFT